MDKPQSFIFFPAKLDRFTAPEAADPNSARIMHNIRPSIWGGRLRRRLGFAPTNVSTSAANIVRCKTMYRDDGTPMLFDMSSTGTLRVTVNVVASKSELDYFGARTSQGFRENFQEDGY